jgi:hypothetical protein
LKSEFLSTKKCTNRKENIAKKLPSGTYNLVKICRYKYRSMTVLSSTGLAYKTGLPKVQKLERPN